MNHEPQATRRRPTGTQRLALLLSPLLVLVAAELIARIAAPRVGERDPFLELSKASSKFGEVEIDGVRWYQVRHADLYADRNVAFPVEKAPGTVRIFCLGGSANAGWPHGPEQIWSRYLEHALTQSYPDRRVEVVNVGAHAYASYRVRPILEDVVRFDPDLIVLWTGNNEFVERRSYAATARAQRLVRAVTDASRLFELLLGAVIERQEKEVLSGEQRNAQDFLFAQLEQMALELRADEAQFQAVVDHYRFTVGAMLDTAMEHGVPTVLLTVPSNLRDWHPNVSRHGVDGELLTEWRSAYRAGLAALLGGDAERAKTELRRALELDPEHAETAFQLARALDGAGDREAALGMYRLARDLDMTPFRAVSALNDTLRELAAARAPDVVLIDAEANLPEGADSGTPGFDLFLDYVHPTRAGNLAIAAMVYGAIAEADLLAAGRPAVDGFSVPEDGYVEARDLNLRLHVLYLLYHMHQEEAYRDEADDLIGVLTGLGFPPATDPLIGLLREGRDGIDRFLEQRARDLRGEVVPADYEAEHQTWYRAHFQRIQEVARKARGG
jgi:tetratricopeptide (TPR) repeat protein